MSEGISQNVKQFFLMMTGISCSLKCITCLVNMREDGNGKQVEQHLAGSHKGSATNALIGSEGKTQAQLNVHKPT